MFPTFAIFSTCCAIWNLANGFFGCKKGRVVNTAPLFWTTFSLELCICALFVTNVSKLKFERLLLLDSYHVLQSAHAFFFFRVHFFQDICKKKPSKKIIEKRKKIWRKGKICFETKISCCIKVEKKTLSLWILTERIFRQSLGLEIPNYVYFNLFIDIVG